MTQCRQGRTPYSGRTVTRFCMYVLGLNIIIVYVQNVVNVMMVIHLLPMHYQMIKPGDALRHRPRSNH